jgi:ApaG protein
VKHSTSHSGNELASDAVTSGVRVTVRSRFLPEQSSPAIDRWVFAYDIRIANQGDATVQLISRHWVIRDAHGHVEEVRGPGVVGKQPTLAPGDAFEYTSFCPLPTPFGSMEGSYQMITADGLVFDAAIARFSLSQPLPFN